MELVVDQLAIVEAPGLVLLVGFVVAHVGHLAPMAGVAHEEQVACLQRLGRAAQASQYAGTRGFFCQQHGRLHRFGLGNGGHVVGIELASRKGAVPAAIVGRVDRV